MKILKQVEGSKIVLYSFETEREYIKMDGDLWSKHTIIFSGTKSELLQKSDEFWKPLVEEHLMNGIRSYTIYRDYQNEKGWFDSPSESGRSAIEDIKGEFILITQETV